MSDLPSRTTIKRWLVTTNHKDIGILYLVTSLFLIVVGGVLALLFRVQLWEARGTGFLTNTEFNQAVSVHGMLMIFWVISPLGVA